MRRLACLFALLAVGCDDPAVATKAVDVLEHGAVAARVSCLCDTDPEPGFVTQVVRARAMKLVDGSCYVQETAALWGRDESESATCPTRPGENGNVLFEDGLLKQEGGAPLQVVGTAGIETCCTGFNLEAFGVE